MAWEYIKIIESVPKVDLFAPNGVHKEFPKSREKDALVEILNGMGSKRWEIVGIASDSGNRLTIIMKREKGMGD